jgi:CheY-like chemotaxis protein
MEASGNHGCQILVVDDEPTVSGAIKLLLQFDGHVVQTVDNGEAALALLEQHQFDLIITDFFMPGMKGDQLAAHIKERRPGQHVIMVTAFAEEFNAFGKAQGDVDFLLPKPFFRDELREAVFQVLVGKNPSSNMQIISNKPSPEKFIPRANP